MKNIKKMKNDIPEKESDYTFKIILMGDDQTGKTNLFSRFFDDVFEESYFPTVHLKKFKISQKKIKNKKQF